MDFLGSLYLDRTNGAYKAIIDGGHYEVCGYGATRQEALLDVLQAYDEQMEAFGEQMV